MAQLEKLNDPNPDLEVFTVTGTPMDNPAYHFASGRDESLAGEDPGRRPDQFVQFDGVVSRLANLLQSKGAEGGLTFAIAINNKGEKVRVPVLKIPKGLPEETRAEVLALFN